jgi:hypothetical protein
MNNKDFDPIDNLAKNAFDGFEVEFKPSDWTNFQQKLKAESAIDQIAKDALEDYQVPFNIKDWNTLEKRLDKKERVLPFFWWFKTAEVGVVALSLFAVFNIGQKNTTNSNPDSLQKQNYDKIATLNNHATNNTNTIYLEQTGSISENPQALLEQNSNAKNENSNAVDNNLNANTIAENNTANATNRSTNSTKVTGNSNSNSNRSTKNKTAKTATTKNKSSNNNYNNLNLGNNGTRTVSTENNTKDYSSIIANNQENTTNTTSVLNENNSAATLDKTTANTTEKFATNAITAIDFQKNKIKNTDPLFEIKRQKQLLPFHCKTYLGGVATVGVNFANSLGSTSIGYGLGFTMDIELAPKLALKTAFIFSSKMKNGNCILQQVFLPI